MWHIERNSFRRFVGASTEQPDGLAEQTVRIIRHRDTESVKYHDIPE